MNRLPGKKEKKWWILGLIVTLIAFGVVFLGILLGGNYPEANRLIGVSLPFFTICFFMALLATISGFFGGQYLALMGYIGLLIASPLMAVYVSIDQAGWEILMASLTGILVYGVNFLFGIIFQLIWWIGRKNKDEES
jgi:hypothetical protein